MATGTLVFGGMTFDPADRRLEGASGPIRLNPKAFDVLCALVARRGHVVSKDELLDRVWPATHVSDGVLKVCVAEIRSALGDSARQPRFIETVHRHGYRFIAEVLLAGTSQWPPASVPAAEPSVGLVGRGTELELLQRHLERALAGEPQVVFVTGEPGIGKTALVEHFVAGSSKLGDVAIARGQCLQQFGSAEAYMPILDAIGRLVRAGGRARTLLRRCAPTWFAQLPWLVEDEDGDKLRLELLGATRERMLREMAEFLAALTAEAPLILVLEDLQWCDPSTVDLVSLLAERRERARLLLLATYRPVDLVLAAHPLRTVTQRLAAKRQLSEITLDQLGAPAVGEYLALRFGGHRFAPEVARLIRERTDGNPLFISTLVDHLLARGAIVERAGRFETAERLRSDLAVVPESLRLLIEHQVVSLAPEDRELLEAASLVGIEFSVAAAAAGAARDPSEAESRYERLADAGAFVRRVGALEMPDGMATARYAFRHALHRETLAAAVSPRHRGDAELRIGLALERASGERSREIASELAMHFEQGGDRARAARYRRLAAETAARRHALAEAETHLERGVALIAGLPASPERDREELLLQSALGGVRMATRGYAATEVETAFRRALELSSAMPREASVFDVLVGLLAYSVVRGELDRALELAERIRAIAEAEREDLMRLMAHHGLWTVHFFRGSLAEALRHLDAAEALYDLVPDRLSALVAYGQDPKVAALALRAILLWHIGYADQALETSRRAVDDARALGHPMSIAFAMSFAGWLRIMRREPNACLEQADAVIAYATEKGMPHWIPATLHVRGWALADQGDLERGIADMEQGLAFMATIGERLGRSPRLNDLVAAKVRAGQLADARALLEESKALAAATGEHYHDPETLQTEGELLLAEAGGSDRADARACEAAERAFRAAIESARREGARALELRAATALARLRRTGSKGREARARLAELFAWFTEGFETADLQDARRLLESEPPPT